MDLAPCHLCRRHVAVGTTCPFCASTPPQPTMRANPVGRVSRAMVFGAALGATAACGGKAKPVEQPVEERHHGGGGCAEPSQQRITDLEKRKAEATTDEEKAAIDQELDQARQPVCMPYGAPPRRRRIV